MRPCVCYEMYDYVREQTTEPRSANLSKPMHVNKVRSPVDFRPNRQCPLPLYSRLNIRFAFRHDYLSNGDRLDKHCYCHI